MAVIRPMPTHISFMGNPPYKKRSLFAPQRCITPYYHVYHPDDEEKMIES
jgi:hypothetical protein